MKVMRYNDSVAAPALLAGTAPVPQPGRNEMLIRVHAVGVTPTEIQWYPTTHAEDGGRRTGAILGHEFSGVVSAVGPEADPAQAGREVFGINDWFAEGATAEYCLTTEGSVASKPARLSHAEAASVPIGALTAWQGLFDRARLRSGERVLIHGAAGAVGVFAVQMARRAGAQVITTASARNIKFLERLGASQAIDYQSVNFEEQVKDMDVVLDCVGGATLARSWQVLRPGGRLVTIATGGEAAKDDRTREAFFIVEPNRAQLTEIARQLDEGQLQPVVDGVVPFEQAATAYNGTAQRKDGRGKLVIAVNSK
jgi:NADPH:quinone reductase-like Zn-dependent oxidoreductase